MVRWVRFDGGLDRGDHAGAEEDGGEEAEGVAEEEKEDVEGRWGEAWEEDGGKGGFD